MEILNHDRIAIDEMIDRFGPEQFIDEIKSIFAEKVNNPKTQLLDREFMNTCFKGAALHPPEAIREIFNEQGASGLIESINVMLLELKEEWTDKDMQAQLDKMIKAFTLNSFRKAWGLK